jgi:hypothetical protein
MIRPYNQGFSQIAWPTGVGQRTKLKIIGTTTPNATIAEQPAKNTRPLQPNFLFRKKYNKNGTISANKI